jgi:cytochrome P450
LELSKTVSNFLSVSLPRYTSDDVTFHDGTKIPKGQMVAVLTDGMRDPKIYKNPNDFDAWRFVKLAKETNDNNHWQFVTTSQDHYGFGHGVHACPGRFFAAVSYSKRSSLRSLH